MPEKLDVEQRSARDVIHGGIEEPPSRRHCVGHVDFADTVFPGSIAVTFLIDEPLSNRKSTEFGDT